MTLDSVAALSAALKTPVSTRRYSKDRHYDL